MSTGNQLQTDLRLAEDHVRIEDHPVCAFACAACKSAKPAPMCLSRVKTIYFLLGNKLLIFGILTDNTMKTVILNLPEKNEKWFETLFNQFHIKHKILTEEAKEDLLLAKLIDESMEEKGEVKKDKVFQFVKKHAE